jgi:hypothetical protein
MGGGVDLMADGLIVQTQKAVAAYLQRTISRLPTVQHVPGMFDAEMAKRVISARGAPHMAFIGAGNPERLAGGNSVLLATYGVYVAAVGGDRHFEAVNTLEAIAIALSNADNGDTNDIDVPFAEGVILGDMENLFDTEAGKTAIAIFGLSFAVKLTIGTSTFADDLNVLIPTDFPTVTGLDGEGEVFDPANPSEEVFVDAVP